MANFMDVVARKAQENPEALQTPRAQSLLQIIQAGDEKRGIEAANNILESMGVPKDLGIAQAKQFFGIR